MDKLANMFAYSDEEKYSKEVEAMEIRVLTKEEEMAKRPMKQDCTKGSTMKKKVKRPKLSIGHVVHIVEHSQSLINSQSIIKSYTEVK